MNNTRKINKGDYSQFGLANPKFHLKINHLKITVLNIHNYVQKIKKENRKEKRKELK